MSPHETEFVFGYGSLLRRAGNELAAEPQATCNLLEHRRDWDVAMDNRRTIPGYKYYLDPETGGRPPVFVTFLNIRPEAGARLNGVAFPVSHAMLEVLDHRERNYRREDVTGRLDVELGGRVWAYVGTPEGRRRFIAGKESGTAVVARQYVEKVRADFDSFGPGMLAEFDATTEPPSIPVISLERHAVPDDYAPIPA